MKKILNISIALLAMIVMVSCGGDTKPSYQYMPNMYESIGYETYSEHSVFPEKMEAMLPVDGTVPRRV